MAWVHSTYRSCSDGRALRGAQGTRRPQTRPDEHGGRVLQTSMDRFTAAGGVERGGGGAGEILGVADVNDFEKKLLCISQLLIGPHPFSPRSHLDAGNCRDTSAICISDLRDSGVGSTGSVNVTGLQGALLCRHMDGATLSHRQAYHHRTSPSISRIRYFYNSVWTMVVFRMNKTTFGLSFHWIQFLDTILCVIVEYSLQSFLARLQHDFTISCAPPPTCMPAHQSLSSSLLSSLLLLSPLLLLLSVSLSEYGSWAGLGGGGGRRGPGGIR